LSHRFCRSGSKRGSFRCRSGLD